MKANFNFVNQSLKGIVLSTTLSVLLLSCAKSNNGTSGDANGGGGGSSSSSAATAAADTTFTSTTFDINNVSQIASITNVAASKTVTTSTGAGAAATVDGNTAATGWNGSWYQNNPARSYQYAEIDLGSDHVVKGANLFLGDSGGGNAPQDFRIDYYNGSLWQPVPGSRVTNNPAATVTATQTFTEVIRAQKFRFVCSVLNSTSTGCRLREIQLMGAPVSSILSTGTVKYNPILDPVSPVAVAQAGSAKIYFRAYHPNGYALTYSTQSLPSWATLTDAGSGIAYVTLNPPAGTAVQDYSFNVVAQDGQGGGFLKAVSARVLSSTTGTGTQTAIPIAGNIQRGYYEYLPSGYSSSEDMKYPLILFFHGGGATGNGSVGQLANILVDYSPPKMINTGSYFPAIVLSPQASVAWTYALTVEFLEFALGRYNVDHRRIYVTGLSFGGEGTWALQSTNSISSSKLCAIAPISSSNANSVTATTDSSLFVWAFHNYSDPTQSRSNTSAYMNAVLGGGAIMTGYPGPGADYTAYYDPTLSWWAGANRKEISNQYVMTLYNSAAHDAWTASYGNADLWTWLYAKTK